MNETAMCLIDVAYGDAVPAGLPISVGVPFPTGTLTDPAALVVKSPSGERRPTGSRVLARHPDGSIRWCLVSFGAREAGSYTVEWVPTAAVAAPTVALRCGAGVWTVESDRLRLTICETGPGVLGELICDGHAYLATPADLQFCVDDATTRHESRRTVRVLEESPLRVRLRVEGAHYRPNGTRCLNYRLDVEIWAGWPAVRLDYHYFNLEPGRPSQSIRKIALETAWKLGAATRRHFIQRNYGLFFVSRHVFNPDPVAIAADFSYLECVGHVEKPSMLLDDVNYPFYLDPPLVGTHDWLGVGDGERAVYARMEDFSAARPNRLVSAGNKLAVEVWPATADPLDLPQGRSRRQTITLAFVRQEEVGAGTGKLSNAPTHAPKGISLGLFVPQPDGTKSNAPTQATKGISAILTAPVYEGRACVSPAWIAQCDEFKQSQVLPAGRHVRIETNLANLVRLDMPYTKFDVGDTDSHYNTGRSHIPLPGVPIIPRVFPRSTPTQTYLDLTEPVWTNNEYDVIHTFCAEIMRTGRGELWRTLRLAARHNIEVDFLHYSDHKWLHRATPAHSVRHTTTGAYPSHFWTQGLLEYYCMTGDSDALEVALALGDKTIENFSDPELRTVLWGFNREIGWSVLLLACLYDVTREPRFKLLLDEMVDYLVGFDRAGYSGAVNLSFGNDRQNLNRQIVGNFFGYGSMLEGIDLYTDITGRADVADWLKKLCHDLADEAINAAREGQMCDTAFSTALAIGFERTGATRFLDIAGMIFDAVYWNATGVQGNATAKQVAYSYRGFTRLLGHAWRHGLLDCYEYPNVRKISGMSAPSTRVT